ncbi:MAG: hypothetical protein EP344_01850 [Bacteroidetes bacterium]|nr:MAG: hypothetical protein EP344_01850 [Bacteroidota bacterium]
MRIVLIVVLLQFPVLLAAQSPWARSEAGFYTQLSYQTIPTYTSLFGANGASIDMIREVSEQAVQFYGEYGISSRTTAIISAPVVFNSRGARNPDSPYFFAQEDTGSISGLGNISLALRHQVLTGSLALSAGLQVDVPSKQMDYSAGLRTGFDSWTMQPTVSAGMGFERLYWQAFGGIGFRTNDYSHFARIGAEGGIKLASVWVIGFSHLVLPFENGARSLPPLDVLTGLYVNDQGWASIGIKGIWEINRIVGIVVSGAGAVWAKHVPESPGLSAGVYFKWD